MTVPSLVAARVSFCHWSRPWWAAISDSERVSVYFTGLPIRRAAMKVMNSSGVTCSLPPKPPPTSGSDDPDLGLGHAEDRGEQEPQDVRVLRGRPHGELLAGRVHDDGARLHERRDESLLAVLPLDHDAVGAGLGDRRLDVAAGAGVLGVELPEGGLVGPELRVREDLVLGGLAEVEGGGELLVVHVDQLGGVPRLGRRTRDDDGDDLAGEGDPADGDRRVVRRHLVGGDRPGVGQLPAGH